MIEDEEALPFAQRKAEDTRALLEDAGLVVEWTATAPSWLITHSAPLDEPAPPIAVVRCYSWDMTRASQPTRLPADVYESAVTAALVTSRTVPQQIAHWARIGRELEMSPRVNHREIARVLAGAASYDSLGEQEQAIVREEWVDRMVALRGRLDYAAQFEAAGESYSELDDDGNLVVHAAHR